MGLAHPNQGAVAHAHAEHHVARAAGSTKHQKNNGTNQAATDHIPKFRPAQCVCPAPVCDPRLNKASVSSPLSPSPYNTTVPCQAVTLSATCPTDERRSLCHFGKFRRADPQLASSAARASSFAASRVYVQLVKLTFPPGIQTCSCKAAAAMACYIASNGACAKPAERVSSTDVFQPPLPPFPFSYSSGTSDDVDSFPNRHAARSVALAFRGVCW